MGARLEPATLSPRPRDAHKGTCGRVLIVAGCRSYPGAAILTALGAGRAGAGYVHLAVPEAIVPWVLPAVPFCVMHAMPGTSTESVNCSVRVIGFSPGLR